jgi:multicomponent Na+:H+ antiporter subunit D
MNEIGMLATNEVGWVQSLVSLPVLLPLVGAALAVLFGRWRAVQRVISLTCLAALVPVSAILLWKADDIGFVVQVGGGWTAPLGIALVVDRLSAMMLLVSSLVLVAVMVYAIGQADEEHNHDSFHPLYLVLAAGVSASFITGDLFNLFVAFEMMLAASYVLITLGGRREQVRSGMSYVVISLVASTFFITVLALLYTATGTVNLADLAIRLQELNPAVRAAFALTLLAVFGIKAGLFPLFFWLPDSYPTAPGPITAIFAGLLTKVGVYAIIRTQTLLFDTPEWLGTTILIVAAATMVAGILGAIAQDDMKRILAFHIISQIGYMIFGLGLFTVAGIAGAIIFVAHQIVVKTALFLVAGMVDRRAGSSRLSQVGGLVRSAPVIAVLFAIPALSLAGLPPLSGFLAKFALVDAGLEASAGWIVGISLGVGLLTLYSMIKIWSGVFWGMAEDRPVRPPQPQDRFGSPLAMVLATSFLVIVTLCFTIYAGSIYDLSVRAAEDLMSPQRYIAAVLGDG